MAIESALCVVIIVSALMHALTAQEWVSNQRGSLQDCETRFPFNSDDPGGYQRAAVGEYPHLAIIGTSSKRGQQIKCYGSLIWEDVVLAPASCVQYERNPYFVGFDHYFRDDNYRYNQILGIVQIATHPFYSGYTMLFNIALVRLEGNVNINRAVLPICLWPYKEIPNSDLYHIVESDEPGRTESIFMPPIIDTKCTEDYLYLYAETSSSTASQCVDEASKICSIFPFGQIHQRRNVNGKIVPLMVGMVCDVLFSQTSITRITKYREWIISTLEELGKVDAASTVFDVEACTQRFIHMRENVNGLPSPGDYVESSDVKMEFNSHTVKLLWPKNGGANGLTCYGAHTDPGAVITLAQCTSYLGNAPTEVMFYDSSVRKISEIIVHPNYTRTEHPNFNDIAILKLESPAALFPTTCGWYGDIHLISDLQVKADVTTKSAETTRTGTTLVANIVKNQCNTAQYDRSQIPDDSRDKYYCFLHNSSYKQETYKIQLGAPIRGTKDTDFFVFGLNLNECDCDFSTPMLGIRFDAHVAWLESILLPTPTQPDAARSLNAFSYIDFDLQQSDQCGYVDGTKGVCEAIASCRDIQRRLSMNRQIIFCGNQTIVCCPQKEDTADQTRRNKELLECEMDYSHLRQVRYENSKIYSSVTETSPHLIYIGWVYGSDRFLDCIGYLITTRDILTTASCLKLKSSKPNVVRVADVWTINSTFIPIHSIEFHPMYNETSRLHDIALVSLKIPINPSWNLFPGCIWLNRTHSPFVQQLIAKDQFNLDEETTYDYIQQMYRSDCEAYLNRTIDESVACMFLQASGCGCYYNPSIKETSAKCVKPYNAFSSFLSDFQRPTSNRYSDYRSLIVGNLMDENGQLTDYLTGIYNNNDQESSKFPFFSSFGTVHRLWFYTDWIVANIS